MNKNLKRIIKLFIFMLVVLPVLNVKAESTIKIERKTYITTGTRKEAKFYTNKGYAYCITPHRKGADQGTTLKYYDKETKGGILYLFEKSGTSDYDYLKTQLAMWILKDNYMPDYYVNNSDIDVVKKAKSLAAEAAKQGNYQSANPTIDISPNNNSFSETSDGEYYKTGIITITAKNYKEEPKIEILSAPLGTKINVLDSKFVNDKKRIEVQVPVNSITENQKFQLKVTATGTVNYIEKYTTGNNELQDLIVLIPEKKTVTKSIDLTVNPVKRTCEHRGDKYYGKDGSIITKEEYEIQCESHVCEKIGNRYFGKNGTVVTELEYKEQCETHICEIIDNKYFGKNGTVVTESEYKEQCVPKQVIVPDTASNPISNIFSIVIGSVMLGTVLGTLTHYYGKKKINN